MSVYKYKTIITKAKTIKEDIEKNNKISITEKWSYYITKAIITPKDITQITFSNASDPDSTPIDTVLKKDEYNTIIKKFINFVEENKRLPNYVTVGDKKIDPILYTYVFSKILVFYDNNKRLPNTCTINSEDVTMAKKCTNPYTSKPHYTSTGCNKMGQCTSYYCGPHSIHQILKKFGITDITEKQLASWAGTTTSGTGHDGLNTAIAKAAKKSGKKLKVKWYYMSDLGDSTSAQFKKIAKKICQPDVGIFFHIGYQGSGSSSSGKIFGHYEMIDKVDIKNKKVRALNSLGSKCGSGYCGHAQWRSYSLQKHYINNKVGVKSVCIITKK